MVTGVLVEVAGIEPASFGNDAGLLRAQPAVGFSAPAVSQASCRRAQSLLVSLCPPRPGTQVEPPSDARLRVGGDPGLTDFVCSSC